MRRAYRDTDIIKTASGEIAGISLGWDHVAEHEHGLSRFGSHMGIGEAPNSDMARRELEKRGLAPDITRVDNDLLGIKEYPKGTKTLKAETRLAHFFDESVLERQSPYIGVLKSWKSEADEMVAAWGDGSFVIRAFSDEARDAVRLVYDAMVKGDAALGSSKMSNAFSGSGPVIMIVSRMSEEQKANVLEADIDHLSLRKDFEDSGIVKKLRDAGKNYFALSPSRGVEPKDSRFNFSCWLNPMEQGQYNYGWVTIEELEAWARDEGPIMKKKAG